MIRTSGPKRRKSRRRGRGVLTVIGGLLVASAVVRIGSETGQAFAQVSPGGEQIALQEPQSCASEADIGPILAGLTQREERVKKRENDLRARIQALSVAETEIDTKLAELQAAEEKLRGTLSMAQSAAEDDLTRLTNVYSTMKPKQAAALFEEMAPEFAAGFLARMRPDAAAAVMAGLTPTAAYTISVVLAGRNAGVPKQ